MNNFAVTSGGLGDIIERGGAAMATANSSLEQTLALGTAGNEILNNPERVGNGLKTLALRLRGSSVELENAGEEVDEFVTSTSKMQGLIKTLTGVDIMRSATEYKDVYEILDEIAKVYNSMTDINKASLTEAMFGKNQANLGTAILTNFQTARDVMADLTSGAAQGSATAEYEKWQQSLEAKIAKLGSTFERFSIAMFDDETVGVAIDGLTGILSIASAISETIGSIPSLAGLAGAALSAMLPDFSILSFNKDLNKFETVFDYFPRAREEMRKTLDSDKQLMGEYIDLVGVGEEFDNKRNELKSRMSSAARTRIESPGFGKEDLEAFVTAQEKAIKGTNLWTKALQGLKSVGASALSMGANMLVSAIVVGAIEAGLKALYNWINATEIAIEKSDEFFSGLEESQKKMQSASKIAYGDTAKRYAELAQSVNQRTGANVSLDTSEYEEFISLGKEIAAQFPGLISGWDAQGNAVLKLKGNVEELTAAIQAEYREMSRGENLVNLKNFKDTGFEGAWVKLFDERKGLQWQKESIDAVYEALADIDGLEKYFSVDSANDINYRMNALTGYAGEHIDLRDMIDQAARAGRYAQRQLPETHTAEEADRAYVDGIKDYWAQNSAELMNRINAARYEINAEYVAAMENWTQGVVMGVGETLYKVADAASEKGDFAGLTTEAENMFRTMIGSYYMDAERSSGYSDQSEYFAAYNAEVEKVMLSEGELGNTIRENLNTLAALQELYAKGAISAEDFAVQTQGIADKLIAETATVEAFDKMVAAFVDSLTPEPIEATAESTVVLSQSIDDLTESYTKFTEARTAAMTALASLSEKGYLTPEESKQVSDAGLGGAIKRTQYGSSYVDYETMRALDKALTQAEIDKQMEAIALKTQEAEAAYLALFEAQEEGNLAELVQQQNIIDQRAEEIEQINLYIDALEGSLSALNAFKQAASMGELGDNFRATKDAIDAISEGLETGRVGTNKFASAVELMFGEQALSDFRSGKISRSDLKKMTSSVGGYYDEDGNLDRDAVFKKFINEGIAESFHFKNGERRISLKEGIEMAEIQEALGGVSVEMATYFLDAINEYANGASERFGTADYLASYEERMKAAKDVQSMAVKAGSVTINADKVEESTETGNGQTTESPSSSTTNTGDSSVEKTDQAEDSRVLVESAISALEAATKAYIEEKNISGATREDQLKVASGDADIKKVAAEQVEKAEQGLIESIDAARTAFEKDFKQYSPFGIPTKATIGRFMADKQIKELSTQQVVTADTAPAEEANAELTETIEEQVTTPIGADASSAYQELNAFRTEASAPITIPATLSILNSPTGADIPNTFGAGGANPNSMAVAKVDGGVAYANGNTLLGELAPEIIVDRKTGTWSLAEYPQLRKLNAGDIVFNGEQTKAILGGKKTNFSKALADGNVKSGKAYAVGLNGYRHRMVQDGAYMSSEELRAHLTTVSQAWTDPPKGKGGGGGSSGGGGEEEEKEWYDWIVKALELAKKATEKAIEDVAEKVGHIAKNAQLDAALSKNDSELKKNQAAYDRYMKQADLIAKRNGLSSSMVKDIQEGKIDITEYSGDMVEKINQYEEW